MKQVDAMPTEGQFVVIYINPNGIWSDCLMWGDDGQLYKYDDSEDEWMEMWFDKHEHLSRQQNVTYFTL